MVTTGQTAERRRRKAYSDARRAATSSGFRATDLLTFIGLENEIAERLDLPVDLVMRRALKARLRDRILGEAIPCECGSRTRSHGFVPSLHPLRALLHPVQLGLPDRRRRAGPAGRPPWAAVLR